MDKEKLLNQANWLLKRVLLLYPPSNQTQDLLKQDIELYLKQFQPRSHKKNTYRQSDVTDLIERILKENP
jgi:hypothetical protein